jgi:hypothetical protein
LPSTHYQSIAPNFISVLTHVPDFTTIGTFELPAGKWALFVTVNTWVEATNIGFIMSCQIPEVSGMSVTYSPGVFSDGYQEKIDLQMQSVSGSSVSSQTLTLQCTSTDGWWDGVALNIESASLMAIQVAP